MKIRFLIVIGYSVLLLSACATISTPQDDVARRATERMELILSGELLAAYEYLSPGYRSSVSPEAYIAQFMARRVNWKAASMLGTECSENRCTVSMKVDSVVLSPVPGVNKFDMSDTRKEIWVNSGGKWWYLPKN